jgi:MFS transporter, UMF1 family
MNKKKLFLWSLYDFANSIVFINFLLYFSQWLVIDGGLSDFWYNATFAISTILLFLTAPVLAAYTDKYGGRKYFLNIFTTCTAVSYGLAATLAYTGWHIFWVTTFFLLGQYFYQFCFVFYNPMIEEISDVSHRTRASGIGQFANALGQLVGILIMLPLAGRSRLAPLLPSVGIFFLLALPMMIFYEENKGRDRGARIATALTGAKAFRKQLIRFFALSAAAPLLVAFFFYNDALVTVTNNYSIYMQRVLAVPDSTKSILLMAIVAMNAIGAILAGWIGDKIGALKTLKFVLAGWFVILPIVAYTDSFAVFSTMTICIGLFIGAMWATSRAYMSTILSTGEMGYGFSFYTLLERFSSFVGPLAWGGIIAILGTNASSYRIAMAFMTVFVLAGLLIVSFWKRENELVN